MFSQILKIPESLDMIRKNHTEVSPDFSESLKSDDKRFLIDISVPKVLFCAGRSVAQLIDYGASKYLNFVTVRELLVISPAGARWTVPTSRRQIFQDKNLKMCEKRAVMELFKSALSASGSQAIQSSANIGFSVSEKIGLQEEFRQQPVTEYLKQIRIERSDLVSGLVNGVCLISQPVSEVTTERFFEKLSLFVNSLTSYEEGCALLVPMYGNGDLAQAFARTAAVAGAVYILNAEEERLRSEVSDSCTFVEKRYIGGNNTILHGIIAVESREGEPGHATLCIIAPSSLDEPPTFALSLPCSDSGANVCPAGQTLIHFIRLCRKLESDRCIILSQMRAFISDSRVMFESLLIQEGVPDDMFSLDSDLDAAVRDSPDFLEASSHKVSQ